MTETLEMLRLARKLLRHSPVVVTSWGYEESACAACGAEVRVTGRISHRPDCDWKRWAALAAKEGTLKIEPMSEIEKAYMDLKGKLAAAEAHIEALEIKAATWLALASPIWVGDESEGHFVCLACNQAGTDDGGCKTIQHLPDCEYAAALAAKSPTPKPTAPKPQILTTG